MQDAAHSRGSRVRAASLAGIILISAALGMLVDWRAPGLSLYARDWLMRARGPLPAPDDIAIVAIDEASIARFGRFPWSRSLTARAIDAIAAAQPKAIAVDVLYTDPTDAADDAALARSIRQAGNVIVAAQLVDAPAAGGPTNWLLPLPAIAQAAAAVGHVNVSTEAEGVGRQVLVRQADDNGRAFLAMAIEAVRVGDRQSEQSVVDTRGGILIGNRFIPVETDPRSAVIATRDGGGQAAQVLRAGRLGIDYIGPAGSFAPHTYSLAAVVQGEVPATAFRGRYVLIGATAASLGDRLASPFVHQADVRSDQHGALMPGVEVLANSLNTILRSRFYSETPDWVAFLAAALLAALTLALLTAAQGRFEALKQCAVLAGVGAGVLFAAYELFTRWLVAPPLTPSVVSFASAGILGLLGRSLATSSRLDAAIAEVAQAGALLAPESAAPAVADSVARLTGAPAVAIFAGEGAGLYRLAGSHGLPVAPHLNHGRIGAVDFSAPVASRFFVVPTGETLEVSLLPLTNAPRHPGMLVLAYGLHAQPPADALLLAAAMAISATETAAVEPASSWLPRGVEWKARALGELNRRLMERARFVDLALRSVEDGLIIASADGRIAFANPRAAQILGASAESLIGRDLLERFEASGERRATLARLVLDRAAIEREITIRDVRPRRYILRLAAVAAAANGNAPVLGIVASLSDITRQHELQQTKNDVVALVSHEMRTPLTAIQGMSELLAQYDMDPARRREMYSAINDEAKRLARMTGDYLDIARLESGATPVRRAPVLLDAMLDRVLLLHGPLAAERGITLASHSDPGLAPLIADADLLARAVGNLVSNAIKYSPAGTEVRVEARADNGGLAVAVADQGYGIPEADRERIFDKFYRIPRVQDAGTPGTGLGLAFVREIAELHGGSVSLTSAPGAGSTFTLRIPGTK